MLKLRVAAAATALSLVAGVATMGTANAATPVVGYGTTQSTSSLVDVNLGSLLHLRLLPDDAKATIDPASGVKSAVSQLSLLDVTSSLLPHAVTIPSPPMIAQTPGNGSVAGPAVNVGSLLPAAIASGGLLPSTLTSLVDAAGAHTGLVASLADINLLGGLVNLHAVDSTLGGGALTGDSDATRSLNLGALSVLNLGSLLNGLGINLANLKIPMVSNILDTLKIGVPGVPTGSSFAGQSALLQTTITQLGALLALNGNNPLSNLLNTVTGTVAGGSQLTNVNGLLGALNIPLLTADSSPFSAVTGLISTLQGTLGGLLGNGLKALNDITLLKFGGLELGANTKAVDSVKGSAAGVIGKLGSISVGGLNLPGLDLSSTLSLVTGTLNTLNDTLSSVLGPLGLGNLVHVGFFDKASNNGVTTSGGYVRSLAGITGLNISINPPADLLGLLGNGGALSGVGGIGSVIGSLNSVVPTLTSGIAGLNSLLPAGSGLLGVLTNGASIKIADVSAGSNFASPSVANPAIPVGTTSLPRTGTNTAAILAIGMLFAAVGIGGRRFLRRRVAAE